MSICLKCTAGCCRRFNVNMTGYDILQLHNTLGLEFSEFLDVEIVEEDNIKNITDGIALFKFKDLEEGKLYRFLLKSVRSKLLPPSMKCMFLQEWGNEDINSLKEGEVISRCGIYGLRPLACATYPTFLDETTLLGISGDPNIVVEESKIPAYKLCPRPVNYDDFADYSGETIKNLVLSKYELKYFKSLANAWNENPDTLDKFYKSLKIAYQNRIQFGIPVREDT